MKNSKSSPEAAAKVLLEKAEGCSQNARGQHEAARRQHLSADKLHEIARGLKSDAAEILNGSRAGIDSASD